MPILLHLILGGKVASEIMFYRTNKDIIFFPKQPQHFLRPSVGHNLISDQTISKKKGQNEREKEL